MSNDSPPATPPPPSSSMKRLRPKQSPTTRPNSSTLPPDEDLTPLKKTRDFPNFSDCHACNTRINNTNPQDRLLLLDSVWRIILLCRKCIKRVRFHQMCPYCCKDCVVDECVKCRDCQRVVHKDCVVRYGDESPWLLCKRELGLGLDGVFVCVDCWVPQVLNKSIRIVKRKKKVGKGVGKIGSRVRIDLLNDRHYSTGREVVLALMAPCGANRKNGVASKDLESGNLVVGFKDGKRDGGLGKAGNVSGVICYKRQRVVKSGDSNCGLNNLQRRISGVHESVHFPVTYNKKNKKLKWRTYERGSLKRKIFLEDIKDGSSTEVVGMSGHCSYERGSLKRKIFIESIKGSSSVSETSEPCLYERGSLKRKIFLEDIKDGSSAVVVRKNGPFPDSGGNAEISSSVEGNLNRREHFDENKCTNLLECDSDTSVKGVADIEKSDHCLLTYSKRRAIHKSQLSG
ncbi:hypothetical protein LIER_10358 [Lithospermum erythrorhizon]|uniref:Uncharacterized protein n=1 Tax=Lithospermum erythrorhizon TaxID=34254 RepID=A0AAV3PKA7_LITER